MMTSSNRNWSFVRGIHRSQVNSPHKGRWRRALMFSLICAWTNNWAKNGDAGDLRCHHTHYDVTVMSALLAQHVAVTKHEHHGISNLFVQQLVQGWGLLSEFSPFRYLPHFPLLSKQPLAIEYHVYIWQVSPQLSCGDTCQNWMWFRESNRYFEISERSFSNPHPRLATKENFKAPYCWSFVRGIWFTNSSHKGPVILNVFPCYSIIMNRLRSAWKVLPACFD